MRPRGPETSYRQFSITQTATSHVETHTQLRDQADIEVFVKELTRSIEGEDHYHPGLPWLLAYHFSLGQWQDLTKRLQARHIYFIDSPAGKNANQWYSQALKRWTLKCLDSVGDVVCGLEVAQVVFGRDSAASTTTSSCHWRGGQASSRPYGSHVDFETMAIRHRQIERSLQNLLTRVDELIRQTESDLQAEVARVNIQHGKESIREAKSVRSLTTLAFIWIPISAVSAAFGTNTRELSGDRMPPLWVYILVATVVTGMTLLAAWIHRRHGDRVWKRLRTSHRDLKLDVMLRYRRFRHRLARRTPHPTG